MAERFNSAQRIYDVLEQGINKNSSEVGMNIWAEIFSIKGSMDVTNQYRIIELLMVLRDEVQLAKTSMAETPINPARYNPVFETILEILKLEYLFQQWSGSMQRYIPMLTNLNIFADLLPADGIPIDTDELADYVQQINELKISVESGTLSEDVKRFFLKYIRILERAIQNYPIMGNRAFRDASSTIAVTATTYDEEAAQEARSTEEGQQYLDKLLIAFNRCISFADKFSTLISLADFGTRLLGG